MPDDEDFDDDRSQFTTDTVNDPLDTDIYGLPELCPTDEEATVPAHQHTYNEAQPSFPPSENALPAAAGGMAAQSILHPHVSPEPTPTPTAEDDPTIPKTWSLAHHKFEANRVVSYHILIKGL